MAGPAGYEQCAVAASDRALGEPWALILPRLRQAMKQNNSLREFFISLWLDRQDSNLRMLGPKPSALPLGDGPIPIYFTTLGN